MHDTKGTGADQASWRHSQVYLGELTVGMWQSDSNSHPEVAIARCWLP